MKGGILAGRIRRGAIDDIMGGDRGGKGAVSQRAGHCCGSDGMLKSP